MRLLYWLSWALSAPFYALSWALFGPAWLFSTIGDLIHDNTTHRAWCVLHRRKCDKIFNRA